MYIYNFTLHTFVHSLIHSFIHSFPLPLAALEREQAILTREQSDYDDIKGKSQSRRGFHPCPHPPPDLSSLLAKLGLEKYEVNFAEEEVSLCECA